MSDFSQFRSGFLLLDLEEEVPLDIVVATEAEVSCCKPEADAAVTEVDWLGKAFSGADTVFLAILRCREPVGENAHFAVTDGAASEVGAMFELLFSESLLSCHLDCTSVHVYHLSTQ